MQARQEAETRIAHLQINLSREKKIATAQSQTFSSVTAATVSAAQSAASGTRETATTTVENSSQLARKLSAPRVRIRIAAGRELIVFVERVKQAQTQWRLAIQRNSRLATSMTMAALSAVLALGLVLLVSRYQPSASAGTHAVTSSQPQQSSAAQWASTAPTESRSSKPLEPTPVPAGKVSSAKPSAVISTALNTPVKVPRSKPVATRRPHHNEDEDYVARDTYVYYGANGKQSR